MVTGSASVVGAALECEIAGLSLTGVSYWGTGEKPGILKGTDYWEAYSVETTEDACCGPFYFSATCYFLEGGGRLFDMSQVALGFEVQVSQQFVFGVSLTADLEPNPAAIELSVTTLVEW